MAIAFSRDCLVMMSRAVMSCRNISITASPLRRAKVSRRESTAGGDD